MSRCFLLVLVLEVHDSGNKPRDGRKATFPPCSIDLPLAKGLVVTPYLCIIFEPKKQSCIVRKVITSQMGLNAQKLKTHLYFRLSKYRKLVKFVNFLGNNKHFYKQHSAFHAFSDIIKQY